MPSETQGKKIVIFTTFVSVDPAYSLNRVVQDQIKMFVNNDYEVTVIVGQGFQPVEMYAHDRVTIKEIPSVPCHNSIKKDPTFEKDVDSLEMALKDILKDADVCLTHDIVYQPAALKHNFALRRVAEKLDKKIKFLHWIHSATAPYKLGMLTGIFPEEYTKLVSVPFENSFYIFFNEWSKPRIAHNFNVDQSVVKTVHHPIDIGGFYGLDPDVEKLMQQKGVYSADAIFVYPCRLDRGKQVEFVIKTAAMMKEFDVSVRVFVLDFHSTGGDKVAYRDELKNMALDWGMNAQEITFTSEVREEWRVQLPHKLVRDFMVISNVLIMPSVSESYSLVTQEAALTGSVIVLNQDFPPFRDIFGSNAIFRKYSSGVDVMSGMDGWTKSEYGPNDASPDERKYHEKQYHKETAGMINFQLKNHQNLAIQTHVRKNRNLQSVFKKELEPLLYS